MRLSAALSGKCQLILIPGETRIIEVEAPGVQRLEILLSSGPETVCIAQGAPGKLKIRVDETLSPDKTWVGIIKADGKPWCRFDAKVLSRELAQIAGFLEDKIKPPSND